MIEHDNGGPVFPNYHPDVNCFGMSLRDWFAGTALWGLLAEAAHPEATGSWSQTSQLTAQAYAFANAMLEARKE